MYDDDDLMFGRWMHSFEEDHGGVAVYRPADFPFPPARGRRELELRPDGTLVYGAIGRGDAPEHHDGGWQPTAAGSVEGTVAGRRLRAVLVEPDRLEVVEEAAQ